jgi:hypothetical protein
MSVRCAIRRRRDRGVAAVAEEGMAAAARHVPAELASRKSRREIGMAEVLGGDLRIIG